jgi:hypothetical protein
MAAGRSAAEELWRREVGRADSAAAFIKAAWPGGWLGCADGRRAGRRGSSWAGRANAAVAWPGSWLGSADGRRAVRRGGAVVA